MLAEQLVQQDALARVFAGQEESDLLVGALTPPSYRRKVCPWVSVLDRHLGMMPTPVQVPQPV